MSKTLVQQLEEAYYKHSHVGDSTRREDFRRRNVVIRAAQYEVLDAFLERNPLAMQTYSGERGYEAFADSTLLRLRDSEKTPHDVPKVLHSSADDEFKANIASMNSVGFDSYKNPGFFTASARSHLLARTMKEYMPIVAALGIGATALAGLAANIFLGENSGWEEVFAYQLIIPATVGALVAGVTRNRINREIDRNFYAEAKELKRIARGTDVTLLGFKDSRTQNELIYNPAMFD